LNRSTAASGAGENLAINGESKLPQGRLAANSPGDITMHLGESYVRPCPSENASGATKQFESSDTLLTHFDPNSDYIHHFATLRAKLDVF